MWRKAEGLFSRHFFRSLPTIVGYRVWNNLMKKYPTSRMAPLLLMVPVSGLLTSYVFFGEQLSLGQGAAIGLVFVGIAIFVNSAGIMARLAR
ncbi:EamA family transporter [Pseudomonas libanensis]|nr:EamA family transporter [Pseudomonas libanensis]